MPCLRLGLRGRGFERDVFNFQHAAEVQTADAGILGIKELHLKRQDDPKVNDRER